MPEEECPHGLDPSWCTFCKKKRAAAEAPPQVRRPAPPRPKSGSATRPAAAALRRTRPPAKEAGPLEPPDALARLRRVVFHASAYGAWPAIAELGLRPAEQLLAEAGKDRARTIRARNIDMKHESGHLITIRDQRAMARASIEGHLDGIGLAEWLALLDERLFFFAKQKGLTTLLARYQETEGQDVVVFDTARLLRAAPGRVEVTSVSPGTPESWTPCPCRNRATFVPIDSYTGIVDAIEEVTVIGALPSVNDLVVRVIRYHPDRTTEVLLG